MVRKTIKRHSSKRHSSKRHLSKRHLSKRHLSKRHLSKRHSSKRHSSKRHSKRHSKRRHIIKGGGYIDVEGYNVMGPYKDDIIKAIKNIPRYAEALNNARDNSDEEIFGIIYEEFAEQAAEERNQGLRQPKLHLSWIDKNGQPKKTRIHVGMGDLSFVDPDNFPQMYGIYHSR